MKIMFNILFKIDQKLFTLLALVDVLTKALDVFFTIAIYLRCLMMSEDSQKLIKLQKSTKSDFLF